MLPVVGITWAIYGIVSVLLLLFSSWFTEYYRSKQHHQVHATVVTVAATTIALMTNALLPMDAFFVSWTVDRDQGLKKPWANKDTIYWMMLSVQVVYYVLYCLIAVFCFFVIPAAFLGATGWAMIPVALALVLLLIGLFTKPAIPPYVDLGWYQHLLSESNGEKAIAFVIGCLFLLGIVVYVVYTAPGLSLLPLDLIRHRRKLDRTKQNLESREGNVRQQQQAIKAKYAGTNEALSLRDSRALENLEDEERIDKLIFSVCGRKCGYILSQPDLVNPVNVVLRTMEQVFPLNYVLVAGWIIYVYLATMAGLQWIGIRFLWATLYRLRRGATEPRGLLFSAMILTLGLLALNYSMISVIAPGYSHFGNQVYCNYTEGGRRDCTDHGDLIVPCDIYGPTDICTPTVSSTLIDRMTIQVPFFGWFFYYGQWVFIGTFILGFLLALFKPLLSHGQGQEEEEEGEEQERQGLVNHSDNHVYGSGSNE
ncbi:hypothetical protein EC973_008423 [Apophysomyces ossiformis]|uniref:Probable lysosomal cobalamin transporter n=1 Tax=Apophysomyces ossiformis TaxID=679940 RepID=A0A8H7BNN6_9FUNG|nr:hypothetical protein EC973_008423 [Apophysomyces ossiformis]